MPIGDAMFLLGERREQPMHVGGLQLFELPPGAGDGWLQSKYQAVIRDSTVSPLFKRRPHRSLTTLGAWGWEDDDDIDIEHHIRLSALPRPGRVRELLALTSRLHGYLLDRHRPLWEAHLIEGLEGRRFAIYSKIHHSLMDGVSSLRLLAQALASDPDERSVPMPWSVAPRSRGGVAPTAIPLALWRGAVDLAGLGPVALRSIVRGLVDPTWHPMRLAPRTILNRPITAARRYAAESWPIERVRAVGKSAGATVNDVILAMCSGALRAYLSELHALPDEPLIAMTPVSLRGAGSEIGGNMVAALLCNLATDRRDPAERLETIHASMETGKRALRMMSPMQATLMSAAALTPMAAGMTPGLRRIAKPAYNLVISNVPGPANPLYWNGARLEGVYPLSIPTDGQALNITVTSYAGNLDFGLTGCRRTVPHLQRLLGYLDVALDELESAYTRGGNGVVTISAGGRRRTADPQPRPTPRPGRPGRRPDDSRPT